MYTIDKSNLKQVVFLIISTELFIYSITAIHAGFYLLSPNEYTDTWSSQIVEIYLVNVGHAYILLVIGIILFIKSKIIINKN